MFPYQRNDQSFGGHQQNFLGGRNVGGLRGRYGSNNGPRAMFNEVPDFGFDHGLEYATYEEEEVDPQLVNLKTQMSHMQEQMAMLQQKASILETNRVHQPKRPPGPSIMKGFMKRGPAGGKLGFVSGGSLSTFSAAGLPQSEPYFGPSVSREADVFPSMSGYGDEAQMNRFPNNFNGADFSEGHSSGAAQDIEGIQPYNPFIEEEEEEDEEDNALTRWDKMMEEKRLTAEAAKGEAEPSAKQLAVANEIEVTVPKELMLIQLCKLCEAQLTGEESARLHYSGRKHQMKENQYVRKVYAEMGIDPTRFLLKPKGGEAPKAKKKGVDTSKFKYTCFICNVSFQTYAQVEAHVQTLQHIEKIRMYKISDGGPGMHGIPAPNFAVGQAKKRSRWDSDDDGPKQKLSKISGKSDFYCGLCDKEMNSSDQYQMHVTSKKHISKQNSSAYAVY